MKKSLKSAQKAEKSEYPTHSVTEVSVGLSDCGDGQLLGEHLRRVSVRATGAWLPLGALAHSIVHTTIHAMRSILRIFSFLGTFSAFFHQFSVFFSENLDFQHLCVAKMC